MLYIKMCMMLYKDDIYRDAHDVIYKKVYDDIYKNIYDDIYIWMCIML